MNIGGIGSPNIEYSRYTTEQQTQKQETTEQQAEQAVTVQQTAQPPETGTGAGAQAQAQAQTSTKAATVAEMSSQLAQTLESSDDEDSDQALINKANAGSTLTQSELSRLKEADPALYARVVKAQQARADLHNQMSRNPSAAKQAMQSAVAHNNSEDQAIVRRALTDEYNRFASKYDQVELSGRVTP